jgi:hypothetical protein
VSAGYIVSPIYLRITPFHALILIRFNENNGFPCLICRRSRFTTALSRIMTPVPKRFHSYGEMECGWPTVRFFGREGIAASGQTTPTPNRIPASRNVTRTHLHFGLREVVRNDLSQPSRRGSSCVTAENYRRAPLRRRRPNNDAMPKAARTNALGSGTGVTEAHDVPPRISS